MSISIFLFPEFDLYKKCFKCQSCVNACPAHAIKWESGMPKLEKDKCKTYVFAQEECLECIMACQRGVIRMVKFN